MGDSGCSHRLATLEPCALQQMILPQLLHALAPFHSFSLQGFTKEMGRSDRYAGSWALSGVSWAALKPEHRRQRS